MIIHKILISIIICNACLSQKTTVSRMYNPNLPIIKENWEGNFVVKGKFSQDSNTVTPPFFNVLKWKLSKNPQAKEKKNDVSLPISNLSYTYKSSEYNKISWLGHASFLIHINGVTIITDPILGNLPFSKRRIDKPYSIDSLTNIDYMLISHDHRDHLDIPSIKALYRNNPNITLLVPLQTSTLVQKKVNKNITIQEAGWYQEYIVPENIRIFFLPSKHWGRRGLFDFNRRLWGSFVIQTETTSILFVGDSAYDTFFKDIYSLFGPIDICILPIGAYAPQSLMSESHITPEEAVTAMNDLQAKYIIPSHYATFDLSDEPLNEPMQRLITALTHQNSLEKLITIQAGEWYTFK